MNAQAALRGTSLQVASRASVFLRRSVAPPRFATVRALNSKSNVASKAGYTILRGNGLRAASLASLRWSPPSLTAQRQFSLSPVAVVAPAPPKMGTRLIPFL